jgi:hypothetical protein
MSSKIPQIYYLTEYSFGHTILIWPKLRYRATNANVANTHGFPGKGMTKNPKYVRAVNRRIGTVPARTAKRQSDKTAAPLVTKPLYGCGAYNTTMTTVESSEKSTMTNIVRKVLRCFVSPPFSVTAGSGLLLTGHYPTKHTSGFNRNYV